MKKVATMTFPNSPSYGASLQMYALYIAIAKLGHDVEVINYINRYMKEEKHIHQQVRGLRNSVKKSLTSMLNYPMRKEFRDFEKKINMHPKKTIHTSEELREIADRYSHVVVGSDQVWNPKVTGFDTGYLLDFCGEDCKKVAYAPSFGVNSLEDEYVKTYAEELLKFDMLSAREKRGRELIHELTGRDCPLVLDPSMLLTKEDWEKEIKKCKNRSEGHIVCFLFNRDQKADDFVKELSAKKGLPVYGIGRHLLTGRRNKEMTYSGPIGPAKWLDVIHDAEYIVTDSFHGSTFSLIFEKKLYVSLASSTNSRLVTLMNTAGLGHRIIGNHDTALTDDIDYTSVTENLKTKREESLAYLGRSLE